FFSQSDFSVLKTAGFATVTVDRSGSTNSVASVNYVVTNGTAISGQNFYATNGTLIFSNGVTSQSFNVTLIANLTILETGGSYVVPAGAQLLSNSSPLDMSEGVIGSNDKVSVLFAFRDA